MPPTQNAEACAVRELAAHSHSALVRLKAQSYVLRKCSPQAHRDMRTAPCDLQAATYLRGEETVDVPFWDDAIPAEGDAPTDSDGLAAHRRSHL